VFILAVLLAGSVVSVEFFHVDIDVIARYGTLVISIVVVVVSSMIFLDFWVRKKK
jgi:hypothetical protein